MHVLGGVALLLLGPTLALTSAAGMPTTTRPLVTVKLATDARGAVDDLQGKPERFTGAESLDGAHRLRCVRRWRAAPAPLTA